MDGVHPVLARGLGGRGRLDAYARQGALAVLEGEGVGRDGDTIPPVTREDLLSAALKLPLDERAALADRLLRSLDELPEPERKKLWLEVADRRLQEMREGKVREIPAGEVFARGRAITSR